MMQKLEKLSGVTVLIAESDRTVRDNLASILQAAGAEVITSYSGKRTLELLLSQQPDVLLCDVSLSDTAGCTVIQFWRALEAARGAKQKLRAIAVASDEQPMDPQQAHKSGFNNMIVLENCPCQLIGMIDKLVAELRKGIVRGTALNPIAF